LNANNALAVGFSSHIGFLFFDFFFLLKVGYKLEMPAIKMKAFGIIVKVGLCIPL
jgi:hypothetical protein